MMWAMSISDAEAAAVVKGRMQDVTMLSCEARDTVLHVDLFGGTGAYSHADGGVTPVSGAQVCTISLGFDLKMDATEAGILIDEWIRMDAPVTVIFDESAGSAEIYNQTLRQRVVAGGVTT